MGFLDENYLLESEAARELYSLVKDLPILDAHNHADIQEIVKNQPWSDIWIVEGATDHYVWEVLRKRGIPEEKITGTASNKEKWDAMASVFPELIGNPTYEWIHLDLRRRFGIQDPISSETADTIWEQTRDQLNKPERRPQSVLKDMKVEIMCTTDNPTVQLPYHEQARTEVKNTKIFPTWRPDKLMNVDKDSWRETVENLGEDTNTGVSTLSGVLAALQKTHDYFEEIGCVASDHGLRQPYAHYVPTGRAEQLHKKAFKGKDLTEEEIRDYKAFMLVQFAKMNQQTDWVTQLHIGPVRDYRDVLAESLGPDTGGDISTQNIEYVNNLRYFFNEFDEQLKIILYCVDPSHLPTLVTLARAFPNVSLGAPWWWNDSPYGMETQLKYIATVDLLSNHAGMVTDSRKLMSFDSRTEMFRRTLCNVVGEMVEKGQTPEGPAGDLVVSLSYDRPRKLFFE
ncbi:MAG TPA: glucuronate isomerase [bacterium]|nr:glucuronate isomerase [bacterium]